MSQFMLVVTDEDAKFATFGALMHSIHEDSSFLRRAAGELLSSEELQSCWFPEDSGEESTDAIFTQAQTDLIDGVAFVSTLLGRLICELLPVSKKIIFWYGDDYRDLPIVVSARDVTAAVESQLSQDAGEVYLSYSRAQLSGPAD